MIECSILNPTGVPDYDAKTLYGTVSGIMTEYWEARGRKHHGVAGLRVDAPNLALTWTGRITKILVARDGGAVVGLLMGTSVPSFIHADHTFEVNMYWGRTPEAEQSLLDKLAEVFPYFTDRFIALPVYEDSKAELRMPAVRESVHKIYGGPV